MNIKIWTFLISLLILTSCTRSPIIYDSTMNLENWYIKADKIESLNVWGSIPYSLPSWDGITVNRISMESNTVMDIYLPANSEDNRSLPVIIMPRIFKREQDLNMLGESILTWKYQISWAHLLSGNGYAVVNMETSSPLNGLTEVIAYLRKNHRGIGIDPNRIGFQAVSSNPGVVLQFLARKDTDNSGLQAAVFLYPDLDAVPFSMIEHISYFIATGELDNQLTNKKVKHFIENCEKAGVDYIYMHHPDGQHGFDYYQDDEKTAEIISGLLEFYQIHLSPEKY